jgi:hypothetical protein
MRLAQKPRSNQEEGVISGSLLIQDFEVPEFYRILSTAALSSS